MVRSRCYGRSRFGSGRKRGSSTPSYAGRDVVVLGLGLTGFSLARHLVAHGARVRVADTRPSPPFAADFAAALPGIALATGPFTATTLAGADLIAISPGVPLAEPPIAAAVARGVEVVGDVELFARALPPGQRVLAITGSNGKTTVTALTGALAVPRGSRPASPATSARPCSMRCRRKVAGPTSLYSSCRASSSRRRRRSHRWPRRCSTLPRTTSTGTPASTRMPRRRRGSSRPAASRCSTATIRARMRCAFPGAWCRRSVPASRNPRKRGGSSNVLSQRTTSGSRAAGRCCCRRRT